jgi:hypothetical protein
MRIHSRSLLPILAVFGTLVSAVQTKEPKLKAEDVVGRHLESIGPAEKRTAIRTRVIEGRARMRMGAGESGPGASGLATGGMTLASEGSKFRIALPFNYSDYWGEQLVFNGTKAEVGFAYIQNRSPLGDFIYRYDAILEEGLFGGVLSTAWPLLERDERQAKLEYAGLKKMGELQVHVLSYRRKKGQADLRIELSFDAATFRHLRTSYNLLLPYESVSPALSESQPTTVRSNGTVVDTGKATVSHDDTGRQGSQYRLEEYFADFKTFDGLTLPARWNILFERASGNKTVQREWVVIIDKVLHGKPLDSKAFMIEQHEK